ncbi:hypothetical protein ACOTVT_11575, partial [Aliarcobacter butzleri]
ACPGVTFLYTRRANDVYGTSVTTAYSSNENAIIVRIPQPLIIGKTVPESSFGYRADAKYTIAGIVVAENKVGRYLTCL